MLQLERLVREAEQLARLPCERGEHNWESDGGRGCPHPEDIGCGSLSVSGCTQAVYTCKACGCVDYGERGGPGHSDCMACRFKHRASDMSFWFKAPALQADQGGAP